MPTKHFTLEEAQSKIPELERIFATCSDIRAKAEARLTSVKRLETAAKDPAQLAIEKGQLDFLAQCLEQALRGIETMGALLKGLEPGLVDFPHRMDDGEEILLCWRQGEKRIRHYHSTTEGFSGRRPLPDRYLAH